MRQRCEHCPVPDGAPCLGKDAAFAYMCAFAQSGEPIKLKHVIERSALAASGPPLVAPTPHHASDFSEADLLILDCDYRLPSAEECGCSGTEHCAKQKGPDHSRPFAVAYADCLRCVRNGITSAQTP